ncbi:Dysbindin [Merluccius polli]|uniref:Dysbindin n=1 Tax=Merluccius polli TaxID=89951 RepID=A0AA47MMP6_MERPO|nr:Dysbindin [Merluccius polli]
MGSISSMEVNVDVLEQMDLMDISDQEALDVFLNSGTGADDGALASPLPAKTKAYLPQSDLERVIHAFITSQLDYCNALYTGIDQSQLRHLQLVQNSAARLLTCTKKREHITPVLASLHWLPIRYRIDFKLLLTVYKSLHGLAPTYLSDLLHHHSPSRALRSADQLRLEEPRSRLKTRGDRAFAVAAPRLWNCLPLHIRGEDEDENEEEEENDDAEVMFRERLPSKRQNNNNNNKDHWGSAKSRASSTSSGSSSSGTSADSDGGDTPVVQSDDEEVHADTLLLTAVPQARDDENEEEADAEIQIGDVIEMEMK